MLRGSAKVYPEMSGQLKPESQDIGHLWLHAVANVYP